MQIEYFKLIEERIKFTWKYKILWIYGFFLGLFLGEGFSGTANLDLSSFNTFSTDLESPSSSNLNSMQYIYPGFEQQAADKVKEMEVLVQKPDFWILIILLSLFIVLFFILSTYLINISKSSLFIAAKYDFEEKEGKINIKGLWDESVQIFWKTFLFDLFWGSVFAFVYTLFIIPVFLMFIFPFLLCLGFIYIPFIFLIGYLFNSVMQVGRMKVVLEDLSIIDAMIHGYDFIKRNFKEWLLANLVILLPGFIFGIISSIFIGIIFLLIIIIGISLILILGNAYTIWTLVLLILGILILNIFFALIKSPYNVFEISFWTKLYLILNSNSSQSIDKN